MSEKVRLIVQIGTNAQSLAFSLATFSRIVPAHVELEVLFIGDNHCMNCEDFQRVKAWLENGWTRLYELNSHERALFNAPTCARTLSFDQHLISPMEELLPGKNFTFIDSNDMIDIRPGSKFVSYILVDSARMFESCHVTYSDPHSGELISIRDDKVIQFNQSGLTLNEYLWLTHNGPVFFSTPPDIELDEDELISLSDAFPDSTNEENEEWRLDLHESLCSMLGEECTRMDTHEDKAEIIEKATAAICATIMPGDTSEDSVAWGLNVKFFDSTLNDRQRRLSNREKHEDGESEPYHPQRLVEKVQEHEFDIIGYVGDELILIECKNTKSSEHIWDKLGELRSRLRSQFRSVNGRAILVTGIPMEDEYGEYAENLRVQTCSITKLPSLLRSITNETAVPPVVATESTEATSEEE